MYIPEKIQNQNLVGFWTRRDVDQQTEKFIDTNEIKFDFLFEFICLLSFWKQIVHLCFIFRDKKKLLTLQGDRIEK